MFWFDGARPWFRPLFHDNKGKKGDGGYKLSGSKNWISNSPIANLFLIWAKDEIIL